MRKPLVALGLLFIAGCGVTGAYVADVYTQDGRLVMVKCAIQGRNGKPDPNQCWYEPVQELPPAPQAVARATP